MKNKSHNIKKYGIILLVLTSLVFNVITLSGCNGFSGQRETTGSEVNNTETQTKADGQGGNEDTLAETNTGSVEDDPPKRGTNYAIKNLFKATEEEAMEFIVEPLLYAPTYGSQYEAGMPGHQVVSVKNGEIMHQRTKYTRAEYVVGEPIKIDNTPPTSKDPETREVLSKMKELTEYYMIYREDTDKNPLVVFSIGDNVYVAPTLNGKVWDILDVFNVNFPYEPTAPSDEKYNGEKNHIIKSIFEVSKTENRSLTYSAYMRGIGSLASSSYKYTLNIAIKNGEDVYIEGLRYGKAVYMTDYGITYDSSISSLDEMYKEIYNTDKTYAARMETLEKLMSLGEYYVVTLDPSSSLSVKKYGTVIVLCSVGDECFFFELSEEGSVTEIRSCEIASEE